MINYLTIQIAIPEKELGNLIADRLLESKLIACAQISGPMTSIYRWNQKIEKSEEYLVMLKTRQDKFKLIVDIVNQLHPYEVPEIIAHKMTDANTAYLKWIDENLD